MPESHSVWHSEWRRTQWKHLQLSSYSGLARISGEKVALSGCNSSAQLLFLWQELWDFSDKRLVGMKIKFVLSYNGSVAGYQDCACCCTVHLSP